MVAVVLGRPESGEAATPRVAHDLTAARACKATSPEQICSMPAVVAVATGATLLNLLAMALVDQELAAMVPTVAATVQMA